MFIRDKVAVVTGGASGIGEAVGLELARRGAAGVALVDRSERVCAVAEAIDADAGRPVARAFVGDVTAAAFRKAVFDAVEAAMGVPRICVPAAGIIRDALAVKVDKLTGQTDIYPEATFDEVLGVNLVAPTYWALEMMARIVADRKRKGLGRWEPSEDIQGSVVFIGSVSAQGNKGQISYAASKAGLAGVAATLDHEAIFHGVRCAVIHPGYTDTPMVRGLGEELIAKHILPNTLLRRLIRPAEIADAICFLASNPAVSGQLWADAGWHAPA